MQQESVVIVIDKLELLFTEELVGTKDSWSSIAELLAEGFIKPLIAECLRSGAETELKEFVKCR